jgi:hypothetical protein
MNGPYWSESWSCDGVIQEDIGGHPPIPIRCSCSFFIQHVFLYCFIIVSSTLLGLYEASHILQVDMGGL